MRGLSMGEALAKGTPGQRKRRDPPAPEPGDCERNVKETMPSMVLTGRMGRLTGEATHRIPQENAEKLARPRGLEPLTNGLEGRRSIQLSYGRIT